MVRRFFMLMDFLFHHYLAIAIPITCTVVISVPVSVPSPGSGFQATTLPLPSAITCSIPIPLPFIRFLPGVAVVCQDVVAGSLVFSPIIATIVKYTLHQVLDSECYNFSAMYCFWSIPSLL